MLNRFLTRRSCLLCMVLTTTALSGSGTPALAQDCHAPYEMVTTLYHPDPGSYSVWDSVEGQPRVDERYVSALPMDDGGVLAVGTRKAQGAATMELLFVRLDKRGRNLWDKSYSVDGLSGVVKMVPRGDEVLVLGNATVHEADKGHAQIYLGFYKRDGSKIKEKFIDANGVDLTARDFLLSDDEQKIIIAVTEEKKSPEQGGGVMTKSGALYFLDAGGDKIGDRSFVMGHDSAFESISLWKNNRNETGYIATGWFENDYKKRIGWVLKLRGDGGLVWQREFDRGLGAEIPVSAAYGDESVLAFGEVLPADSGSIGAWLMMLSLADGSVRWQRYYHGETGHHDYRPRGLMVNKDGLISALMQAKVDAAKVGAVKTGAGKDSGGRDAMHGDIRVPEMMDYVHVLNIDPRGVTLSGDAYFYGVGAQAMQITVGPHQERLIAGYTRTEDGEIADIVEKIGQDDAEAKTAKGAEAVPNLPDAPMPEGTMKGLEMLRKHLEDGGHDAGHEKQPESDESKKAATMGEAAQKTAKTDGYSDDGWIVMGTALDTYQDPCKKPVRTSIDQ